MNVKTNWNLCATNVWCWRIQLYGKYSLLPTMPTNRQKGLESCCRVNANQGKEVVWIDGFGKQFLMKCKWNHIITVIRMMMMICFEDELEKRQSKWDLIGLKSKWAKIQRKRRTRPSVAQTKYKLIILFAIVNQIGKLNVEISCVCLFYFLVFVAKFV